jgi:zinc transporter ZupT
VEDWCARLNFQPAWSDLRAPALAALLAIVCGVVSIRLATGRRKVLLVRISGALLASVALFGLIPELIHEAGWWRTVPLVAAGYGVLMALDSRGFAVCPSCSHGEKFAGSLVAATAVHAFVDGWGLVAARGQGTVSGAIVLAILIHKAPEGLALGAMLRAASSGVWAAVGLCFAAEMPTILGGAAGLWITPPGWIEYLLSLVAGTFLFLGIHALLPRRASAC